MRFLLKTFFTLATLAVLAVGAVAFLVPRELIRDQAIDLVKQHTGRDLTVDGKTSFAFFPSIGVELGGVALSSPPDMAGGPILRMKSLTLSLKLLPLLTRSVEVERFVLERPIFDLRLDRRGRRNWDFSRKKASARSPAGGDRRAAHRRPAFLRAQAGGLGGGMVQNIRLGTVRIIDGVVLYADAKKGTSQRLDGVNVALSQDDLDAPLEAEGDLVWRREKVAFKGQMGSPAALTRGGPSAVTISATSKLGKAGFGGRAVLGDAFSAEGDINGETASVRDLADWAGSPLVPGKGFGGAMLKGHIKYSQDILTFTKTKMTLDGMNGQGKGSVSLKGAKPYIRAALAVDKLDLNVYLGPGGTPHRPRARTLPPPETPTPTSKPGAKPKPGQSLTDFIEQLNKKPKPEVRAWSRRALSFAELKAVDADVNLNTGALLYDKIKVGQSAVTAKLKGGVLTANLTRIQLYGGSGTGRITLNGARAVPALGGALDLKGVSALPLLSDAMAFDWISGSANLALNLSGSGRTEDELVRTLRGNGSIRFANGAIEGINIPAMVRGFKQGQIDGWKKQEREKTDFSSLSGTFTMQNGVASNNDLNLVGPLVRMTGAGTVHVPGESVDFSLTPRLVGSLEGQGSQQQLGGLVIPVRVHGSWSRPKVKPDLKKIIENPDIAVDAVEKIGKAVKGLKGKKVTGKDVEAILQGVLGGGQQPQQGDPAAGGEPQPQPQIDAEDLLKQLFKKK